LKAVDVVCDKAGWPLTAAMARFLAGEYRYLAERWLDTMSDPDEREALLASVSFYDRLAADLEKGGSPPPADGLDEHEHSQSPHRTDAR
jgi:hypothetical protein